MQRYKLDALLFAVGALIFLTSGEIHLHVRSTAIGKIIKQMACRGEMYLHVRSMAIGEIIKQWPAAMKCICM